MVVTEQYLDEGNSFSISPPTMLSYWPDFSKDDGTLESVIVRCENSGGELIWSPDYAYKCEDIDY
jgi:hypothetical protein